MCSNDVMTARRPPASTKRTRPRPSGPCCRGRTGRPAACARSSAAVTRPQRPRGGVPKSTITLRDVGGDDQDVGAELAGEQRGGEVLVDDGLDAAQRVPVRPSSHDRDAAAAGADDDEPGVGQRVDGGGVDDRMRLGRGDDAAPALLAAVLPDLAVLDRTARASSRGRKRPTGLVGSRKPGSSPSTSVRVTRPAVRCGQPAGGQRRVQLVGEGEARWSPGSARTHQSSGTGGTTCAASSFLTSRLPTCGPLPWVSTTSTPGGDDVGDVAGRPRAIASRWALGRRRAVGPGHGVAAEGDHDAAGGHPADPSGRCLSGEVLARRDPAVSGARSRTGRGRAGSRPPRRRRRRGRSAGRRRRAGGRRCRS